VTACRRSSSLIGAVSAGRTTTGFGRLLVARLREVGWFGSAIGDSRRNHARRDVQVLRGHVVLLGWVETTMARRAGALRAVRVDDEEGPTENGDLGRAFAWGVVRQLDPWA
jgi:hypothetical protein